MANKPISKTQAAVLALFLGIFGIHRKVMGYKNWWLQTLTLGGFFIWALIDFINIVTDKMPMADGTKLS